MVIKFHLGLVVEEEEGGHGLEGKIRVRAFYKCQLHFDKFKGV
jgi:hypothetical protein